MPSILVSLPISCNILQVNLPLSHLVDLRDHKKQHAPTATWNDCSFREPFLDGRIALLINIRKSCPENL